MGKNKIYEKNLGYTLLKPIVDWNLRHSYRRVEVQGYENIPYDGALLFTPNHCNTLMDALVMLRANKGTTVFGARADMFKRPFIAKIMYFLRILPMARQRDGLRNVLKNYETTDTIVEILENDVAFCMYPEGRHRPAHSLLPLGKGAFRATLAANAKFGDRKPIYIVPVGIEYGDYFRYRSTSLVTYGNAMNITEFVKSLEVENEAQMMEPMRQELTKRMSGLITYIKDDEDYEGKWELTKILNLGVRGRLSARLAANRETVAAIEDAYEKHPEEMKALIEKTERFSKARRKAGISIYSFSASCGLCRVLWKSIVALIGLPYYIASAFASMPMWILETLIRGKIKDKAFRNTVSFGVKLGLGFIMIPLWAILSFCLIPSPWVALAAFLLALPTYSYLHDYNEFMRRLASDIRLMFNSKLKGFCKEIINEYTNLK